MTSSALHLLQKHELRTTEIRQQIVTLFLDKSHALSHNMIEESLVGHFDRVTIYRTLKSFEEKGLIHRIADDNDIVKYAICQDHCDAHAHFDNHVHFKCDQCGLTYCLEHVTVPAVTLPAGYTAEKYQFLVIGLCDKCR